MNNGEKLIRQANIQKIAEEGIRIYQGIKHQYEPKCVGKFLAIEIESRDTFLDETTSGAVELARAAHPEKVFYVVKIGFSASEVLAGLQEVGT